MVMQPGWMLRTIEMHSWMVMHGSPLTGRRSMHNAQVVVI